jgi:hypothetical protein
MTKPRSRLTSVEGAGQWSDAPEEGSGDADQREQQDDFAEGQAA